MDSAFLINTIVIADNQDITSAGMHALIQCIHPGAGISEAKDKKGLLQALVRESHSLVVLDYALFDFASVEELLIIRQRFPETVFLLFSDELTNEFIRQVHFIESFNILLKDCSKGEINKALYAALNRKHFLCARISQLLMQKKTEPEIREKLTSTEREILKAIAQGKNTKEIAAERFLSIHTVTTHRKNIFRKLNVNNIYEATKYALKAGILDAAEYYI
ncbi:MAG: response regulator transcription factor [Bacteroidales bacterium]|jgi:DNA-binding NarL/FixJ family response regulator|nr:response regulator transcription factor [Bacteroidales bacterium]